MFVYESLSQLWGGIQYIAGTYIHPHWKKQFPHAFHNHNDAACIAHAVGYCLASNYQPVVVVLQGEYVSTDELSHALRASFHLPIFYLFLTPMVHRLSFALPIATDTTIPTRHMENTFLYIPMEDMEKEKTFQLLPFPDRKDDAMLDTIQEKLRTSRRPVVLLGDAITHLPSVPPLPIVVAGSDSMRLLPSENKYFMGKYGQTGDRAGNMVVQNADLLLIIGNVDVGTRKEWFAREATIMWVSNTNLSYNDIDVFLHYECHPDVFLEGWRAERNASWNEWIFQCRQWRSRWLFETPSNPCFDPYLFHALFQQYHPGLCRTIVARQDDFLWCPLYQQTIVDHHARRLLARPLVDVLMFACGAHASLHSPVVVFLPQDNALSYEHLFYIGQNKIPLIMFLTDVGRKNRFRMNQDGYYDMVEEGEGLEEITDIPSVHINMDNVYYGLAGVADLPRPVFVWVHYEEGFVPCPIRASSRPPEEMVPDHEMMVHEMIVQPV